MKSFAFLALLAQTCFYFSYSMSMGYVIESRERWNGNLSYYFLQAWGYGDTATIETLPLDNRGIKTLTLKVFDNYKNLKTLNLTENEIISFPDKFFAGIQTLRTLSLDKNFFDKLNPGLFNDDLTELDLSNNLLTVQVFDVLKQLGKLQNLILSKNQINNIDSAGDIKSLKYLDASYNTFSSVSCKVTENIETLILAFNSRLTSFSGCKLENLKWLDLSLTGLKVTNQLKSASKLETLILNGAISSLEELDLSGLSLLKKISLNVNNLGPTLSKKVGDKDISLFKIASIEDLSLEVTGISKLEDGVFDEFTELKKLSLASNKLEELNEKAYKSWDKLKELDLSNNQLSYLDPDVLIPSLKTLNKLYLRKNNFITLDSTFLSGFSALTVLDLSYNSLRTLYKDQFKDVPLEYLYLNNNQLTNIRSDVIGSLNKDMKEINIADNKFSQGDKDKIIENIGITCPNAIINS